MRHCTPAQTLESFKGVPILVVDKLRLRWTLLAMFICMTVMPLIAADEADSTAVLKSGSPLGFSRVTGTYMSR